MTPNPTIVFESYFERRRIYERRLEGKSSCQAKTSCCSWRELRNSPMNDEQLAALNDRFDEEVPA